jgi:hypothetical protein
LPKNKFFYFFWIFFIAGGVVGQICRQNNEKSGKILHNLAIFIPLFALSDGKKYWF